MASYTFYGQRPGEEVILVTKKHVWVLTPIIVVWLVLLALVVLMIKYFGFSIYSSLAIAVSFIIGAVYAFYKWYSWHNSDYIVTNQRVLKVDQPGLFGRVISEADIEKIQEISTHISGPVRTMLNFGKVKIQTASSVGNLDLIDVTDPYSVQQTIVGIQKKSSQADSAGLS